MPGAMRKLGLYLGLVEDEDARSRDTDGYDDYDDEYDDTRSVRPIRGYSADAVGARPAGTRRGSEERAPVRGGVALDPSPRFAPGSREDDMPAYRITTLHPRTYNEARTIGEHFRDGTPVIMNLTEMDDTDAKRLVDFAAGLIFGLRGSIERVTNKVFLLTPANIEVTAEDKARIAEGGFFNQS
jgi:cell division inhibitor SepF